MTWNMQGACYMPIRHLHIQTPLGFRIAGKRGAGGWGLNVMCVSKSASSFNLYQTSSSQAPGIGYLFLLNRCVSLSVGPLQSQARVLHVCRDLTCPPRHRFPAPTRGDSVSSQATDPQLNHTSRADSVRAAGHRHGTDKPPPRLVPRVDCGGLDAAIGA